ncbi:MAG: hypothetical protein ACRCU6_10180 [Fusobacteriaceae bacterium]
MQKFTDFVNIVKYGSPGLDGESIKDDLVDGYCYYKSPEPLLADIQTFIYTLAKMSSNNLDVVLDSVDLETEEFHLEDNLCELLVELTDPEAQQNFDYELIGNLANKILAFIFADFTLEEIEDDLLHFE